MPSPIETSSEHLQELGRIAARWSSLDPVLVQLLSKILRDENVAEAVYFTPISQRARLDTVSAMITASNVPSDAEKTELLAAIKAIGQLWSKRNDLMHSPIVRRYRRGLDAPEMIAKVTRPANPKNSRREVPLPLHYLKAHAERLDHLIGIIFGIVNAKEIKMLNELTRRGPSRDK